MNEHVVLKLKLDKNFTIEQIIYIQTQWLNLDIYVGQHISKILGEEQTSELIQHLTNNLSEERYIIQHQGEQFWLHINTQDEGFIFEFMLYNPFEKNFLTNKLSYELLDLCDEGVILTNSFGQIIYANNAFCKLSKYPIEHLTGKMFYPIFIHSENYSCYFHSDVYDDKMICMDGAILPVKITIKKIQIHENKHIIAYIVKDLSNMQKAENEISFREQLLDCIYFTSQRFLFTNNWSENVSNVLEHIGFSINATSIKLYENFIDDQGQLNMKLHAFWRHPFYKYPAINNNLSVPYFPLYEQLFSKLSNGEVYIVENDEFRQIIKTDLAIIVPIFVTSQWWGFLCVEMSQSSKIWKETEIKSLKQIASIIGAAIHLHHILKEQSLLKEKAENSNRLKTTFLSYIGHELRTPLNSIVGFSDLIEKHTKHDNKLNEYAHYIKENSYGLLKTIDYLVEFAKLEAKNVTIHVDTFNIYRFLTEVVIFAQQEANRHNKKKIQVSLYCNDLQQEISTDKRKLFQIYEYLINYIINFIDTGQIEIGYSVTDTHDFYLLCNGATNSFVQQEFIVKSFNQPDNESTYFKSNIDISLTIVKKIVELLQGKIVFQSTQNRGFVFFIQLPHKISDETSIAFSNENSTKTIYVYDDDDELYTKLYSILRQQYANVKRIRDLSEIQSDASYIIINTNHTNTNFQNDLTTIKQKYPLVKIITHQFKNPITHNQKITSLHKEDQCYWNILRKMKSSTLNN